MRGGSPGCAARHARRPDRNGSYGFTLIELLITVAIVAILAAATLPLAELVSKRARENELRVALRDLRTGIDAYKRAVDEGRIPKRVDDNGYPPTLEVLVEGVLDPKSPRRSLIYFMRRMPRNPLWTDPTTPAARTWGLRSYASSFDNPRNGEDVYDVFVPSDAVGLNGVPYREW
ncbi:MAG: type II secretion system protein [Proteobacteria bacterium]|nr:type II secretion system protein [Burkholderiales bacterium]